MTPFLVISKYVSLEQSCKRLKVFYTSCYRLSVILSRGVCTALLHVIHHAVHVKTMTAEILLYKKKVTVHSGYLEV